MPVREHWMLWDSPVGDFTGVPLKAQLQFDTETGTVSENPIRTFVSGMPLCPVASKNDGVQPLDLKLNLERSLLFSFLHVDYSQHTHIRVTTPSVVVWSRPTQVVGSRAGVRCTAAKVEDKECIRERERKSGHSWHQECALLCTECIHGTESSFGGHYQEHEWNPADVAAAAAAAAEKGNVERRDTHEEAGRERVIH
ncbi:hypothetical protein EYF80_013421 [Liparis tanakae]|uniref:Uncharacterized protein n=1 Tax=Liparis tanakae TaxID=230148 RepID=A0A4Z2IGC0_9TELE|nr:hypothetical protein EYF80_013421 [Liparis tanakae]